MPANVLPEPLVAQRGPRRGPDVLARLNRAIGWLVEVAAAILVVLEVLVLLLGVVSRYVFHRPLLWTDKRKRSVGDLLAVTGGVVMWWRDGHPRSCPAERRGCSYEWS